jgi:hypothetical protein
MKPGLRFALLLPVAALLGCTVPPATTSPAATPTGAWQNWQIQAGTAITSPPNTYPSFLGAIQIQGTQASGIFIPIDANGSGPALDLAGAFNASTEDVTLATYGTGIGYIQPATPYTLVLVDVIGGCVYPPSYTGVECNALVDLSPAVGVQIAPLNGTFTGTLTGSFGILGSNVTPIPITTTASLPLTQSSTPNSSGAFPLTGIVTFTSTSDLSTTTLTGTVNGEGISIENAPTANPVASPTITLAASANPTATQITITNLAYTGPAVTDPYASLTGTLTLQQ